MYRKRKMQTDIKMDRQAKTDIQKSSQTPNKRQIDIQRAREEGGTRHRKKITFNT